MCESGSVSPLERSWRWVLYCRSGNRSGEAGRRLLAAEFSEVHHLRGGLLAWLEAGCPVETSPGASSSPGDVMSSVNTVLTSNSRDAMLSLAAQLDAANNLGCPLN